MGTGRADAQKIPPGTRHRTAPLLLSVSHRVSGKYNFAAGKQLLCNDHLPYVGNMSGIEQYFPLPEKSPEGIILSPGKFLRKPIRKVQQADKSFLFKMALVLIPIYIVVQTGIAYMSKGSQLGLHSGKQIYFLTVHPKGIAALQQLVHGPGMVISVFTLLTGKVGSKPLLLTGKSVDRKAHRQCIQTVSKGKGLQNIFIIVFPDELFIRFHERK